MIFCFQMLIYANLVKKLLALYPINAPKKHIIPTVKAMVNVACILFFLEIVRDSPQKKESNDTDSEAESINKKSILIYPPKYNIT